MKVPWGPHVAFLIELDLAVRTIMSHVLCVPKKLPIEEFQRNSQHVDPDARSKLWNKAQSKATHILRKQAKKPGVRILGSPNQKVRLCMIKSNLVSF